MPTRSPDYSNSWKTAKMWTGGRTLTMGFADGSVQEAIFQSKP